jgi:hypothetical protein
LELAFSSKEFRGLCENDAAAKQEFGIALSDALRRRLADLDAAPSLADLPSKPIPLPGGDGRLMSLTLTQGTRLIISANHPKNPTLSDGGVDWEKVSRIQIVRIEATNG